MHLQNLKDHSVEQLAHFHPLMDGTKLKNDCITIFTLATKQHAASVLIDQQQKPSETLQEYVHRFSDLPLKSRDLLLHQVKALAYITHFIHILCNQKVQCCVLGKLKPQYKMP